MDIEKKEVYPNIFSLRFNNQYETCSTFLRLQEFYESPFKEIKGHVFTLETYMDRYAKDKGNFTYTSDWGGFNVPGHIVQKFFKDYRDASEPFLNKEYYLHEILEDQIYGDKKFYVIGHYEKDNLPDWTKEEDFHSTLAHELAHGLFYLNPKYKKTCLSLIEALPEKIKSKMSDKLLNTGGYCKAVLKDEFQAYLSTSDADFLKSIFGVGLHRASQPFKKTFKDFVAVQ
jgi:hypothetical protein